MTAGLNEQQLDDTFAALANPTRRAIEERRGAGRPPEVSAARRGVWTPGPARSAEDVEAGAPVEPNRPSRAAR